MNFNHALFHPDLNPVIDGLDEVLFGAEVAFGGLDGGMPQQQLNLAREDETGKIIR